MGFVSPLAIVFFIILIVAFVGAVIAYALSERTFRGYKGIASDARKLRDAVHGELFRDGDDLVISGNYQGMPSVIRFSYSENTPGMSLHAGAPSTMEMVVVPRGSREMAGKAEVKTGDNLFDSRFTTRTDHPEEAKMLFGMRSALGEVRKLCCSSRTYLSLTKGQADLSELTIPDKPYQHAQEHLESLARLARALKEMPGADKVAVQPIKRQKHVFGRVALAIGVVAAIIAISAAARYSGNPGRAADGSQPTPSGVRMEDVALLGNLQDERLATDSDFNPDAAAWLKTQGTSASGKVEAKFSGPDATNEIAYVFVEPGPAYRVVLLGKGAKLYDEHFPYVGIAAKVPKSQVDSIDWVGRPPETPDGDGLLVLRNPDDKASGLVIFLQGSRVVTAVPSNYQAIHLE